MNVCCLWAAPLIHQSSLTAQQQMVSCGCYNLYPSVFLRYESHDYCFQCDHNVLLAQHEDPPVITVQLNPWRRNWRRMEDENWFNLVPVFLSPTLFSVYIWELKTSFMSCRNLYSIKCCFSHLFLSYYKKEKSLSFLWLFPVQKHVETFALFDFYLIFRAIHGLQNPHV